MANYVITFTEEELDTLQSSMVSKSVYWGKLERTARLEGDRLMAKVYANLSDNCMALFKKVNETKEEHWND